MSPTEKPDPYRLDGGDGAGQPTRRPIELTFDVQDRRGIDIVTLLPERLVDGPEIERLGDALGEYVRKKRPSKVILDMHGIQHMSSSALGLLLTVKASIEGNGGKMCMANLRDDLQEIFRITKLDKVLSIKESVDAAAAVL